MADGRPRCKLLAGRVRLPLSPQSGHEEAYFLFIFGQFGFFAFRFKVFPWCDSHSGKDNLVAVRVRTFAQRAMRGLPRGFKRTSAGAISPGQALDQVAHGVTCSKVASLPCKETVKGSIPFGSTKGCSNGFASKAKSIRQSAPQALRVPTVGSGDGAHREA